MSDQNTAPAQPAVESHVVSTQANPDAHIQRFEVASSESGPNAPAPEAPPRPEWLPEEFESPEQFSEWYNTSRPVRDPETGRFTARQQEQPAAEAEGAAPEGEQQQQPDAEQQTQQQQQYSDPAQAIVAEAGLDWNELQTAYFESGQVPAEALTAIQEKFPFVTPDLVHTYLAGAKAAWADYGRSIRESVGGDATFKEAQAWAESNFSPAELEAYNESVLSGNAEQAKLAVAGMVARYRSARGNSPRLVEGDGHAGVSAAGFESQAQVVAAMSDPRYRSDPAYRESVRNRLRVTPRSVL